MGHQALRYARGDSGDQFEAFAVRPHTKRRNRLVDQVGDVESGLFQLQTATFNSRKVQDAIDLLWQRIPVVDYYLPVAQLVPRDSRLAQHGTPSTHPPLRRPHTIRPYSTLHPYSIV